MPESKFLCNQEDTNLLRKSVLLNKIQSFISLSIFAAILLLVNFGSLRADIKLENWQLHTNLNDIRQATSDIKQRLWCATAGGIFIYDLSDTSVTVFKSTNGLISYNTNAIAYDTTSDLIFAGTQDGIVYSATANFEWSYFTDIKSANFPKPSINDILFLKGKAYIGGGFGIAVFDLKKKVFTESAVKLGSLQTNTTVNQITIIDDTLWAATEKGIAFVPVDSIFADPKSWGNLPKIDDTTNDNFISIAYYEGKKYYATPRTIYRHDSDSIRLIRVNVDWDLNNKLRVLDNVLYNSTAFYLKDFIRNKANYSFPYQFNDVFLWTYRNDKHLLHLSKDIGIGFATEPDTFKFVTLDAIASNITKVVRVSSEGRTIASSNGNGLSILDNGLWTNYNLTNTPTIGANTYYRIGTSTDGRIAAASWGNGLTIARPQSGSYVFEHFDYKNSPLLPITGSTFWVICGEPQYDRNALLWFSNCGTGDNLPVFYALDKNNKFIPFYNQSNPKKQWFGSLCIDNSSTKWAAGDGIYYFNEKGTLDNASDDIYGELNTSNSELPSNEINSIAIDKSGFIWIATPLGLAVILNPDAALRKSNVVLHKVTLMNSQPINEVMVDALDNKWLATSSGITVINSDATAVVATFDVSNTKIPANYINTLATNLNTGEVYVGTDAGLAVANSLSINPLSDFDLRCYPQPFYPDHEESIYIEGLTNDATVVIATIDGVGLRRISTQSRRAIWDGKDDSGNIVPTGVYLVIATSATNSSAKSATKIAVIRK